MPELQQFLKSYISITENITLLNLLYSACELVCVLLNIYNGLAKELQLC